MKKSSVCRTRGGHFNLYLAGKYAGQFDSLFKAIEYATSAGELREFHPKGAIDWETAE